MKISGQGVANSIDVSKRLTHFITIEGYVKDTDLLIDFMQSIPKTFEGANWKHKTNCELCDGTGEVGAKGIYADCAGCEGGFKAKGKCKVRPLEMCQNCNKMVL